MSSPGQLAAIIASVAVISIVLELVRRRLLSESLSLIWLTVAGAMVVASTVGFRFLIDRVAPLMGIRYPPSALILLAILGLVALSLYFSVRMSRLNDQCRKLAQRVALLELKTRDGADGSGAESGAESGNESEVASRDAEELAETEGRSRVRDGHRRQSGGRIERPSRTPASD